MIVAVVIPTVPGREEHLERCWNAYMDTANGATLRIYVEHGHPSCGEAWIAGMNHAEDDGYDYVHLTADDLEPQEGWLDVGVETVEAGNIPAPLVFMPDGSLQSAGISGMECHTGAYCDWMQIDSTTVPFLTREMWQRIGMIPLHYCTDLWVSHKGRLEGWETVVRTGMRFTHYNAPEGRIDQHGRTSNDRAEFDRYKETA